MVRVIAEYNVARYPEVLRWPLAEGLLAFEHRMKQDARHDYELQLVTWAILAQSGASRQKSPPDIPALLKE